MKRCPTCSQTFDDDALSFCLHDGDSLVSEISSPPIAPLQATMMAAPPSSGGTSYPTPPTQVSPGSGSFNPNSPNSSWQNPPANASWATPSLPQSTTPPRNSGFNKKWIFGGLGCLGLSAVIVIVGVILFAFSGPRSMMNPYKGDLKALAPTNVGIYKVEDVDVLGEKDKEEFGAVDDAIGVAYNDGAYTTIEMFLGNYSTPKAAEAGLESFKNKSLGRGFTNADSGSKKEGRRTVGTRFILDKDTTVGKASDGPLPDGARIVYAQVAAPRKTTKVRIVGWTNGTVVHVMIGPNDKAISFEPTYDAAMKSLID